MKQKLWWPVGSSEMTSHHLRLPRVVKGRVMRFLYRVINFTQSVKVIAYKLDFD